MKETYNFKHLFLLCFFLIFSGVLSAQTISNVTYEYSCPCRITVTYELAYCGDVVLYYSPDTTVRWMVADTFRGKTPGTYTDVWNCEADGVNYGLLYFKLKWVNKCPPDAVQINCVCWATRNVDAPYTFAANPTDAGMLYQWDYSIGWSSTNPMTSFPAGNTWGGTNSSSISWTSGTDPSPVGFRVPDTTQMNKLLDTSAVTIEWVTLPDGVKGCYFTDKINKNSIFLPAAGYRNYLGGTLDNVGLTGYYWSSTPLSANAAYNLLFKSDTAYLYNGYKRFGFFIRPVAE